MFSNANYSTDGQPLQHNRGSRGRLVFLNCLHNVIMEATMLYVVSVCSGSMNMVRVGSRRLPLYPLVTVGLGLLNAILLLAALVFGIYCE